MTTTKEVIERLNKLTPEQLEQIGGGLDCSASEIKQIFDNMIDMYESAIDFTSYVIERVDNAL